MEGPWKNKVLHKNILRPSKMFAITFETSDFVSNFKKQMKHQLLTDSPN